LELWVEEKLGNFYAARFRVTKTLFSGASEFQKVDIVETLGHGRMLLIDDLIMVSERDEFVYHDMISHVPLFSHPNPKKVLVIGGGDGGTLREVLRHPCVEKCVMVEIDPVVVDACKTYLPQTSCAMDDPRADVRIEDGVAFMANSDETFNLIIIDSTDPIGPATPLFGEAFYRNVFERLGPDGMVVAQGESPFYEKKTQTSMLQRLAGIFPITGIYNYVNLTYPGCLWSFVYASKTHSLKHAEVQSKIQASGLTFKYYNGDIHRGAFLLPSFQAEHLESWLTDNPSE